MSTAVAGFLNNKIGCSTSFNLTELVGKFILCWVVFFGFPILLISQPGLPVWDESLENPTHQDWLVHPVKVKTTVYTSSDRKDLIVSNGLIKRSFRLNPNAVCTDYKNLVTQQQLLRAISPEARLIIDQKTYRIGGLYGQNEKAYLKKDWVDQFKSDDRDLMFQDFTIDEILPRIQWKTRMWTMKRESAIGKTISFRYLSRLPGLDQIEVKVHYEMYDGIPLMSKWLTLTNKSNHPIQINQVVHEILAMVEEESAVIGSPSQMKTNQGLYIESNYAFNNAMRYPLSDQTTHWKVDSTYTSQVNYNFETPCLLEVYADKAPGIVLAPGGKFESIRSFELLQDSYDRERRGLAVRKMYRIIAPWTNINPIFMHLVSKNDEQVRMAIDQCAETGYEALILSFGSHCNMEDTSRINMAKWKALADYAHSKNVMIGSYSLFSSRKISDEDDVIHPLTGKPGGAYFGNAPCFGSNWGLAYSSKLKIFFEETGFDLFENDGPYPGDVCASTTHPGHLGLEDSQWRQIEQQKDLYKWCNERGIYINAPDWYFLDGSHKIALGYREVNFSLPRDQQKIINRQNIFDGTWDKNSSMGWGFVPLTRYQGGGPEAILEPLFEHVEDYEQLMVQYYGAGIQACYRGPRLYDSLVTKKMVIRVLDWYKKYRQILNSDLIHLRRADGKDWDGWLHVNPELKEKGLLMVFNPLDEKITRKIKIPLYYTGLTGQVTIAEKENKPVLYQLNRNYQLEYEVTVSPQSYNWFVIR